MHGMRALVQPKEDATGSQSTAPFCGKATLTGKLLRSTELPHKILQFIGTSTFKLN